jgi:hypothetical protein
MRHHPPGSRRWRAGALILAACAALGACGGGGDGDGLAELLAPLIRARFVPPALALVRGATQRVELEVTCDRDGLDTVFGRLNIEVRLDPDHKLPASLSARLLDSAPNPEGYAGYPCNAPLADPNLRLAHVPVEIVTSAEAAAGSFSLVALVRIEPLVRGEPSKDSTLAELALSLGSPGTPSTPGAFDPTETKP